MHWTGLRPYVAIARPDHWFKNVWMLLGALLAFLYHSHAATVGQGLMIAWAFAATCLVASSNYVLNEILDAPTDRSHPTKRLRPIPSGRVSVPLAYGEWLVLAVVGVLMACFVNPPFVWSALALLGMGVAYNVPPLRSKDVPYIDVLSESLNNPIRLLLGWFAVSATDIPPLSLVVSYWMVGAFFMAAKRLAEYRNIGSPNVAAAYRNSFRYYDENRLLVSMFYYVALAALCLGVFIIRYHLELVLALPLLAGVFSSYMNITFKGDSAAQRPERLYRERGLMVYLATCLFVCVGLMFVRISFLYTMFHVPQSPWPPLWTF